MSANERTSQDAQENVCLVVLGLTVLAGLHVRDDLLDRVVLLVRERCKYIRNLGWTASVISWTAASAESRDEYESYSQTWAVYI